MARGSGERKAGGVGPHVVLSDGFWGVGSGQWVFFCFYLFIIIIIILLDIWVGLQSGLQSQFWGSTSLPNLHSNREYQFIKTSEFSPKLQR